MKIHKTGYCLSILIILISIGSCQKARRDTPGNYFTLGGEKYSLSKGYLESWGVNTNGSYDFDLYLISSGIQYQSLTDDFLGTGNLVYIDLNTSSEIGLEEGTYNYSPERNAFTFVDGIVGADIDIENELGELMIITGGTIKISMEGDDTRIDFQLTSMTNEAIKGNFTGHLIAL